MNAKTIGARLRVLRGEKTVREVAKDLGISPSALTMYELGQRSPKDEVKKKLAEYFGTTVGALFFAENAHE